MVLWDMIQSRSKQAIAFSDGYIIITLDLSDDFLKVKHAMIKFKKCENIFKKLLVFYDFWYCLQSYKMLALISIGELAYKHAINLLGKNLAYICQ